jgi:2-polyprenyl-6-hydroxyphenyl methylase/3-demethylubiquinone-9 3-methyltransferase
MEEDSYACYRSGGAGIVSANTTESQYRHASAEPPCNAAYLTPPVVECCRRLSARRILDLGCGNGALCSALSREGFDVVGCDPSQEGIALAARAYPHIQFKVLGAYNDPAVLGTDSFDVVVSTEVIEHLYFPRSLPRFAARVLRPQGYLILSTPYHGYLKNLTLALAGEWDRHLSLLWSNGHIKFWSRATLTKLLSEEGFAVA